MQSLFTIIEDFDTTANLFIASNFRNETLTPLMLFATELGRIVPMSIFVLIVVVILLYKKLKREAYFVISASLGAVLSTTILKTIYMRPRPEFALLSEPSFSFPSGHATSAVAVFGSVALVLFHKSSSKWMKLLLCVLAFLLIFWISFSRLYLGAHYLSDVLGGWLVGGGWIILSSSIYKVYLKPKRI